MVSLFTATFFDITDANITTMIGYIKSFVADFTPLMLPILAIGLGAVILLVIIRAIT
jgi:hypothetical protein